MAMIWMIVVFVIGYALITMEHVLKVNKTAIALLMCVLCWAIYMGDSVSFFSLFHPEEYQNLKAQLTDPQTIREAVLSYTSSVLLLEHMGDVSEIIFFLLGAMTIVEIVDMNGGFNFVRDHLLTQNKRRLLWRVALLSFLLSATLDNLTTTIVMLMVLRKLVHKQEDRWYYAAAIVLAANSGGAFSPIGDVTTIMLWIKGNVTSIGLLSKLLLPSLISCLIPIALLQAKLQGQLTDSLRRSASSQEARRITLSPLAARLVFCIGIGGLISVPLFRYLTGLPPFMGVLLVFSLLWCLTEVILRGKARHMQADEEAIELVRVNQLLHKIDLGTILFFLGILLSVAAIEETGALRSLGLWLEKFSGGNAFVVTAAIGLCSSVVDNVPLVASCIGMYELVSGDVHYMVDGEFWQLLAYCAGVGGSMLIIGSAAGVVAMGMEQMTFSWYFKRITWVALLGYLGGILTYWLLSCL
ncbi:MAG: sodium:proton antiporter NhaD [Porphyromonadaceae bacterium]|nr:sodium:proton antiporter NhaD [Porphyromonadaceae bacterium]